MSIGVILYFLYILILFYFILKSKRYLMYFYIFSLPLFGLQYDTGLQIELVKLISFIMLIFCFHLLVTLRIYKPMFFFLSYMILVTVIMSFFIPHDVAKNFSPSRGEYRWIFQIINWIIIFSPLFFLKAFGYKFELYKLYKIFLHSLTVVSLLGFFQVISYYAFGYDPFPIALLQGEEFYRMGQFDYGGLTLFRMSSIGGEPKHLAYSLSIGILILFSYLITGKYIFSKKKDLILLIMFSMALILTFSAQGIILTVLYIAGALLLLIRNIKNIKIIYIIPSLFIVFLTTATIYVVTSKFNFHLFDILKHRTLMRILESGIIEDWNEAVMGFVNDHPEYWLTGVGLGNIHLYAQDYIPEYAAHYMINNVFVAKSGLLRIFSELGLLGILAFLFMYLYPYFKIKSKHVDIIILKSISLLVLLAFSLSANGPVYYVFLLFLMYGVLQEKIYVQNIQKGFISHNVNLIKNRLRLYPIGVFPKNEN